MIIFSIIITSLMFFVLGLLLIRVAQNEAVFDQHIRNLKETIDNLDIMIKRLEQ